MFATKLPFFANFGFNKKKRTMYAFCTLFFVFSVVLLVAECRPNFAKVSTDSVIARGEDKTERECERGRKTETL